MTSPASALGRRLTEFDRGAAWLAFAGGVAAGLGHVPFAIWPLGLIGLALATALVLTAPTARAATLRGWATGTGYFALTLFWIVEPFLVDVAVHGWMAPFALVFLSGGLALFWGAAGWASHSIGRTLPHRALAFAVALSAVELARGYVLTGFPWVLPAYIWTETPVLQLAQIFGPFGLTSFTLGAIAALAFGVVAARPWITLAAVAAPLIAHGAGLALRPPPPVLEGQQIIRIVQPNAPQHLKWHPDHAPEFFRRQVEYTGAPAETRPSFVLWPESTIPTFLGNADRAIEIISEAAGESQVGFGITRISERGAHNSLVIIDGSGDIAKIYDKHHLVPFGEYMPFRWLFRRIGIEALAARTEAGYTPGPGPSVETIAGLGKALILICYEAIFTQDVHAAPERADWMLQVTNDAWFGQISGPYQHLAQARSRAVEQGLPLVRSANTGVSAMIGPGGRVLASIPLGEAGWIDAPLPAPRAPTLYAQTGDLPVALVLAALLGWLIMRRAVSISD